MNASNVFQTMKSVKAEEQGQLAVRVTDTSGSSNTASGPLTDMSNNPIYEDDRFEEYRTAMSFQICDDDRLDLQPRDRTSSDVVQLAAAVDRSHLPPNNAGQLVQAGAGVMTCQKADWSGAPPVQNGEDADSTEKFKTKMMSVWNNVKYGWSVKMKTNFSYEKEIWLLGVCYHKRMELYESKNCLTEEQAQVRCMEKFKQDFMSRIWLTYRREFPMLAGSKLTTDCGWGCMLRSGQMLLAQALICHFLTRDWRLQDLEKDRERTHRMIVKWFADCPHQSSPFAIHHLVNVGVLLGKKAGDWYGPASVAQILWHALEMAAEQILVLDGVCVYVAKDCTIYQEDVIDLCTAPSKCSSVPTSPREKIWDSCQKCCTALPSLEQGPLERTGDPSCHSDQQCVCYKGSGRTPSSVHPNHTHSDMKHRPQCCQGPCTDVDDDVLDYSVLVEGSSPPPSYSHAMLRSSSCSSILSGCRARQEEVSPSSLPPESPCSSSDPSRFPPQSCSAAKSTKWRGVVILVPVRLGGEKMNSIYYPCIKRILMHRNCIGIIGGRPKHSLYFLGWQEDKLIYLDPHYCQETIDVRKHDFPLESFHCSSPRKMSFSRMDPSCAIGFYCRTREEFWEFTKTIPQCVVPLQERCSEYPMFVIADGHSRDSSHHPSGHQVEKLLKIKHCILNSEGAVEAEIEGEDFVLI